MNKSSDLDGEKGRLQEKQTATGGEAGDESYRLRQRAVSSLRAVRLQERVSQILLNKQLQLPEDAQPHPVPNGAEPRNRAGVASSRGTFSVIKT